VVNTVLGLLGVAVFVPCVIALAAGLTWAVVRISPPVKDDVTKPPPAAS
jgi:hypothetical protein